MNRSKEKDPRYWLKWFASGAIGSAPAKECDSDVYVNGLPLAALDGRTKYVDPLIAYVASASNAKVDWHYSGGRAHVLFLGTSEERERAIAILKQICEAHPRVRILQIYDEGAPGIMRAGVTPTPPGAIGSFMDDNGNAAFMVAAG